MNSDQSGDPRNSHQLTDQQRGLYLAQARSPGNLAYNLYVTVDLSDGVDLTRLENAVNGLIRRHAILRTGYTWAAGELVQTAQDVPRLTLVRGGAYIPTPFDLARPPLLRARVDDGPGPRRLGLELHHIAVDGMSLRPLFADLEALYLGKPLDEPTLTYHDYARRQSAEPDAAREGYWLTRFAEPAPAAELPTDFPRASADPLPAAAWRTELDAGSTARLAALARKNRVTLFQLLLALHLLFLARNTGADTVTAGTPVSGRDTSESEHTIGMLVRTLPMRCEIDPDTTFADFLKQVRKIAWEAIANQEYPFSSLAPKNHRALFDTIISVQHSEVHEISFLGRPVRLDPEFVQHAMFDIDLQVFIRPESLEFLWVYRDGLFREPTIRAFHRVFAELADAAVADPSAPLGRLLGRERAAAAALPEIDFEF